MQLRPPFGYPDFGFASISFKLRMSATVVSAGAWRYSLATGGGGCVSCGCGFGLDTARDSPVVEKRMLGLVCVHHFRAIPVRQLLVALPAGSGSVFWCTDMVDFSYFCLWFIFRIQQ